MESLLEQSKDAKNIRSAVDSHQPFFSVISWSA